MSRVHRWNQQNTTGPPPLGVIGGASCAIGNKIYHIGGHCNHDLCLHNSLHELGIDDYRWRLLMDRSDTSPTKKKGCGMVAIHQALLVVGGTGPPPQNPQPLA